MRRSKKGFTVTEVLLAMAVIGVISALAMPQLIKSVQKDKAGIVLGKAVEQIELGCQNMIQDYNSRDDAGISMVDTLSAMDGDFEFSINTLSSYIGAKNSLVIPNQNTPDKNVFRPQYSRYKFEKFPAEMSVRPRNPYKPDDRDGIVYDEFIIDVNGLGNRPDAAGKDRFYFQLRNDGKMIPVGLDSNSCDGDSPSTIDENCTARVVKDGFKIKYNW